MFESGVGSDFSIVCTKKNSVADPQTRETKGLFVITNEKDEEDKDDKENGEEEEKEEKEEDEEEEENGEEEEDGEKGEEEENGENEEEEEDEVVYEKFGTSNVSPEYLILDWCHSDWENFFDQKWIDYLGRSTKDLDDQVTFK
jgi:hypothetical protein